MQPCIGILRCELERQRKALAREMDMMQKERVQLVKKGNQIHQTIQVMRDLNIIIRIQMSFLPLYCYTPVVHIPTHLQSGNILFQNCVSDNVL